MKMGNHGCWEILSLFVVLLWCSFHCCQSEDFVDDEVLIITDSGGDDKTGKVFTCVLHNTPSCTPLTLETPAPRFPVYDPVEDYIYWTDYTLDTICRTTFSGDNYDERWLKFTTDPSGLAIDTASRTLFVHQYNLKSVDMKTKRVSVVVSSIGWGSLSLDTINRKIFLSQTRNNKIIMMNYDGSELETLVSGLSEPRSIAYNGDGKLFYCDKGAKKLASVTVSSKINEVLRTNMECVSVSVWGNYVYYTDSKKRGKVFKMDQNGTALSATSFSGYVSKWARITTTKRIGCPKGFYGRECRSRCGYCLINTGCDTLTGRCVYGCEQGWLGDACKVACPSGTYGNNCTSLCGHCSPQGTCNHVSGVCSSGCRPGWAGSKCEQACPNDTYGTGCRSVCGHCSPQGFCDTVTGVCDAGCQPGWTGTKCTTVITKQNAASNSSIGVPCEDHPLCVETSNGNEEPGWAEKLGITENGVTLWAVIAICAVLLLMVLVMAAVIVRKNRKAKNSIGCQQFQMGDVSPAQKHYEETHHNKAGSSCENDYQMFEGIYDNPLEAVYSNV